jgi:hypothetical protein
VYALGAAAEAEEPEQKQNEDHDQDEKKDAEDTPPFGCSGLRARARSKLAETEGFLGLRAISREALAISPELRLLGLAPRSLYSPSRSWTSSVNFALAQLR